MSNDSLINPYYQRLISNSSNLDKVLDTLQKVHKEKYKKHPEKEIKEAYQKLLEIQLNFNQSNLFLFDTLFYPLLNRVLENIKASNPTYDSYNHVLISKSRVPNAYCYGNGIMVVNLGIISLLQNEDQLAALLAHEYAHHHLKHMEKGILHKEQHINAKETKQKLRKINRSEYEQLARIEQFQLESAMIYRTKKRTFETEADSLSAAILGNTEYNASGLLELLNILDSCDQEKYDIKLNYSEIFSNGSYQFSENLLLNNMGLEVKETKDQAIIDALKTHPDCNVRIELIQEDFSITQRENQTATTAFENYQLLSDYEMLFQDIENRRYANCLKNALLLKQQVQDGEFLDVLVANCLAEIYFAQKDHMLWNYLPLPREEYNYNYLQLLVIIENIRLSELKQLSKAYIDKALANTSEGLNDKSGYVEYLKLQQKCINESRLPAEEETESIKNKFPLNSFITKKTN